MAAPVFHALNGTPSFTEGSSPVLLDTDVTVTDADLVSSSSIDGATLTLVNTAGSNPNELFDSALFDEGQVIVGGIVIGFAGNSAGTLTITFNSDAHFGDVDTVMQSLTYSNTSTSPPPSATIGYQFDDGEVASGSVTVSITATNNAPTIDGTGLVYYQPGTAGVALSPAIQLTDDGTTLALATVALSAHNATDLLSATVGSTGIAASFNSTTGVLTLSNVASVAAYRQVLASVTYSSSATEPMSFGDPRTVTWQVSDGSLSGSQSSSLDFYPVLDLDQSGAGTGFATTFTESGPAIAIVDSDDHIARASTDFDHATIMLTNAQAGDTLSATGLPGGIIADTSVPGQITLTSNSGYQPAAVFEAALRQVTFGNAGGNISPTTRDITVTVTDAVNTSNVTHTTITIVATNDAGSATNDTGTTNEDTVLSVAAPGVLANDNDPDGLVVITGTTATAQGGSITFAADGSYTYTPAANFSGADSVVYTAQDPFGSTVSATLNITVNAVNDAPVFAHFGTTHTGATEQTFVLLNPAATVADVELDALNGGAGNYAGASLIIGRSGSANAQDTFSFGSSGATFTVDSVNHVLLAGGQQFATYSVPSAGPNLGTLSINFNSLNTPATTALVNNVLEHISYKNLSDTPPASVTMHYTFNDGNAGSQGTGGLGTDTANRIVDITPVDDAPVVTGSVTLAAIAEDSGARLITQAQLIANATDVDSGSLTAINLLIATGLGTLVNNNNGTWSYTPAANDDTSVSFSYQVTDGVASPVGDTATLDLTPVNDPPVVTNAVTLAAIAEDSGARLITQAQLLGNASDIDGPPLTAINLAISSGAGSLVNNGDGTWSFTPASNDDTSVSFSDQVTDGVAAPVNDTATLDIIPVNDAPVVSGSVTLASIAEDSGARLITQPQLLGNASDIDGPSLTAINLAISSGGGALVNNGNGTWSYTPALHDDTSVSFSYQITDGVAAPVADTATLDITPVITPPAIPTLTGTPNNDSFTAPAGSERIDAGGGIDTVTFNFKLVDATFTWSGNQVIVDTATSHTVLTGFETYVFTDGTANNNDSDPLVDDLFYYAHNHDVWNAHTDADLYFHTFGWRMGNDPNAFFSTSTYLSANPDVKAAGVDPLIHFDQHGWQEGRIPSITFDPDAYLAANPDVKAAHVDPLLHFLQFGAQEGRQPIAPTELVAANGFDYVYYLNHNTDVLAAHVDAFQHFETIGWKEGRNPNALFNTNAYLAAYGDVKAANINPLDHYDQLGWHEGRDPSVNFDTADYLAAYPDVAAAHIDPLVHYLQHGIHEGRSAFADGHFG